MAKKADPKKIGAFVVGAIVLVMVGLVVFGSGKFFAKTRTFVLFFEGSVGGLNVGAPVNFRGVRVGSVKDIVALRDARGLVNNLDDQVQPISSDAREALHTATAAFNEGKGAVEDARGLIANVDSQVEPISTQAQTALQTATATLEEGKTAMRDARGLITHVDAQVEPISTGAREAPYRVDWSRCVGKSWELDPVLLHRHQAGQPARPGDDLNTKTLGIELRRRF